MCKWRQFGDCRTIVKLEKKKGESEKQEANSKKRKARSKTQKARSKLFNHRYRINCTIFTVIQCTSIFLKQQAKRSKQRSISIKQEASLSHLDRGFVKLKYSCQDYLRIRYVHHSVFIQCSVKYGYSKT